MERCKVCNFPNTRPGLIFQDGTCQACINYEARKTVDWEARGKLLKQFMSQVSEIKPYNILIPVSGGKDSHFLVHTLVKEYGMRPLLATVTDSFTHTNAGTFNLRNLITKFNLNHWQYTISHDLFIRATRAAFEDTGEPLKFVEYAIYTIPIMLAQQFKIPYVMYGENSSYEYGSTATDSYNANPAVIDMLDKIVGEMKWWVSRGIAGTEVDSILPDMSKPLPQVFYMSYFKPWSSVTNLECARKYGFKDLEGEWEREGTIENFEQIDSVAYMVHLWMKYPKFGFQRPADIASRRVREGALSLDDAKKIMTDVDPILDSRARKDFCDTCGYTEADFYAIVNKFWKDEVHKQ